MRPCFMPTGWAFLALFLAMAAQAAGAPPITVVAAIHPIADLVRQVAGAEAEVITLLPPGVSPHTFEPTPGTIQAVAKSRIFFAVGAGLEIWAGKLIRAAAARDLTVVDLAQGVPLITDLETADAAAGRKLRGAALGLDEENGRDHGHDESGHAGGVNPHYWTDPVLALGMVDRIETALLAALPGSRDGIAQRAANLRTRLRELDAEIRRAVAGFRSRRLVTFHNSWPYFARRYGLELAGVIETAPGREPSPRHLLQIVAAIRALKIPVVFAEPQLPARPAEVIAQEARVRILILDPIGGVPPDRVGYLDLMRYNLHVLEEGLR